MLVWLDSGAELPEGLPWSVQLPDSNWLPVIRHQHMVALKCHLFTSSASEETDTYKAQSASHLPNDYGRSLRPNVMAHDAFYSLTEVFSFVASSQTQFLNLISVKLDSYTTQPREKDFECLPNLKYAKHILYHQIQKTQRVIESIRFARQSKWPKDTTESGRQKADVSAQGIEQDFELLLRWATFLHQRSTEAINDLMSSISISESQKAMDQAQRVGKLTLLAFIFVPLGFTTSFFGMNVAQINGSHLGIKWWVTLSLSLMVVTFAVFCINISVLLKRTLEVTGLLSLRIKVQQLVHNVLS